jgi:hypothetical protein
MNDGRIEGIKIMSLRFVSPQALFSLVSALFCSAVLINVATSAVPFA